MNYPSESGTISSFASLSRKSAWLQIFITYPSKPVHVLSTTPSDGHNNRTQQFVRLVVRKLGLRVTSVTNEIPLTKVPTPKLLPKC